MGRKEVRTHRDKYGWYSLHGKIYQYTDCHEYYQYFTPGLYIASDGTEFLNDGLEYSLYHISFEDGTTKYINRVMMPEFMNGATRIRDKEWEDVHRFYMKRKEKV